MASSVVGGKAAIGWKPIWFEEVFARLVKCIAISKAVYSVYDIWGVMRSGECSIYWFAPQMSTMARARIHQGQQIFSGLPQG